MIDKFILEFSQTAPDILYKKYDDKTANNFIEATLKVASTYKNVVCINRNKIAAYILEEKFYSKAEEIYRSVLREFDNQELYRGCFEEAKISLSSIIEQKNKDDTDK